MPGAISFLLQHRQRPTATPSSYYKLRFQYNVILVPLDLNAQGMIPPLSSISFTNTFSSVGEKNGEPDKYIWLELVYQKYQFWWWHTLTYVAMITSSHELKTVAKCPTSHGWTPYTTKRNSTPPWSTPPSCTLPCGSVVYWCGCVPPICVPSAPPNHTHSNLDWTIDNHWSNVRMTVLVLLGQHSLHTCAHNPAFCSTPMSCRVVCSLAVCCMAVWNLVKFFSGSPIQRTLTSLSRYYFTEILQYDVWQERTSNFHSSMTK